MITTITANYTRPAELEVEYRKWGPSRGWRDSLGAPLDNDEPPGIEVLSIKYQGKEIDWNDVCITEIEEALNE